MADNWIETDEREDVAGSIRHIIRTAHFVGEDTHAWKWVIIALHSALQGACVCHLTTTAAPMGAISETNNRQWVAYFEESRTNPNAKPPKAHLMCLPELLKAIRKPNSAGNHSNGNGIAISGSELNWLIRFHNEFRNQFTHFVPMAWSIEVSGIPLITKLIARIIRDIFEMGWAFRHQDREQHEEMQRILYTLETIEWTT